MDTGRVTGRRCRVGQLLNALEDPFDTGERERGLRETYLVHADNWVAELSNRGVVGLLRMPDAEIGDLFDPGVQKSGIGRQLVAHVLRLHSTATLDVFGLNSTARAFYARPRL
ncbi:GNAT family N-acetyltransferase [Nocardia sp. NPDC004860]|uniref:GNAT family N-acetyltransferase n=1 Tax=Nocardia sp. NPDC004860 TaxID=3154557 RepID=UPI0033A60701